MQSACIEITKQNQKNPKYSNLYKNVNLYFAEHSIPLMTMIDVSLYVSITHPPVKNTRVISITVTATLKIMPTIEDVNYDLVSFVSYIKKRSDVILLIWHEHRICQRTSCITSKKCAFTVISVISRAIHIYQSLQVREFGWNATCWWKFHTHVVFSLLSRSIILKVSLYNF